MQRIYVTIRPLSREDSVLYFPPEAFGPFKVLHQIGAGALGPVFRAHERGHDRLVAIKVFRLELTPEQAAALVEHLEALIGANINHPHIAAPIATGVDAGAVYLAQEYVLGESLDVVLRDRGRYSIEDTVALVESLAAAIDHAAARGVQHRMLHPRDIIVSADAARITGFGIASALSRVAAKLPTRSQYSAADGPSDIYALAVIAFEALTGKRPSLENVRAFQTAHGAKLAEAFSTALAPTRGRRPQRAKEFANVLRAGAELPAEPPQSVAPADVPEAPTRYVFLEEPVELELRRDVELTEADSQDWSVRPESHAVVESRAVSEAEPSPPRRWPIAVAFVAFAVVVTLGVGYFLRPPAPAGLPDRGTGVDATVVDLPAPAPGARAARGASDVPTASGRPRASVAPVASAPPPPTPSRPASGAVRPQALPRGSLLIRSSPADADVSINGLARGKTPVTVRDLEFGSYTIRVARSGYATEERILQLTPRRPTASTTFELRSAAPVERSNLAARNATTVSAGGTSTAGEPAGLNVLSRPSGARVFVNGRLVGSTPLALGGFAAGAATVRIELDGYQPWTTTVRVAERGQTRVAASLDRR